MPKQHYRLSDLHEELLRTGGRWHEEPTINHGSEITVDWTDTPDDADEPWVRIFDPIASSWSGPYSVASRRLQTLPDDDEEHGGWQRVWDVFPEDEYPTEVVIYYYDQAGDEIGVYHTGEDASEHAAWEAWLNDPATADPVDDEYEDCDSHAIATWALKIEERG